MKIIATAFSIATLSALAPVMAQVTTEKTEVRENADGSVTEKRTVTTTNFNPEVQTKIVKYFDPYKAEAYGLPPGFAGNIEVKRVPKAWRTTRIAPGVIVKEEERPYLIAAPPKLVEVLPKVEKVRYYVAGGNVVGVDEEYRVVDSVQIPSVKITVDE